jgi:hypothetical protein
MTIYQMRIIGVLRRSSKDVQTEAPDSSNKIRHRLTSAPRWQ